MELYKLIFLLLKVSVKMNMSRRVKMLEFLEIKIRDFHTLKIYRCASGGGSRL